MKIIVITDVITRRAGGVFHAVRDMFVNDVFKKVSLEIFSYYDNMVDQDLPSWGNLPIRLFKPYLFLYSRKLKTALLNSDADIYHQEGLWRYSHLLMEKWASKTHKPIVCTPHGMLDPYIIKKQGKLKRLISDLFFQRSLDAVTCYQALCLKELEDIRKYGLKQPVAIIPNGIRIPPPANFYRPKDTKRHLLFLGRLHEKKGIDMLLKAFSNIKKENEQLTLGWHLDIVGWDHEGCLNRLKAIVSSNQLQECVTFHGGLYGEEKDMLYATCDAYILPSHGEGLPMTVLEAWAWKKPVIITPECHLPEGYATSSAIKIEDNTESVKDGLIKLFNMTETELQEMGSRGYQLVQEQFCWESAAKKMLLLYRWLLGECEKPDFVYL